MGIERFELFEFEVFSNDIGEFSNNFGCFSTGFPQGVEKMWERNRKKGRKLLRQREKGEKCGGNEWKSEIHGVVENSVENVENFSEGCRESGFPQVRSGKFSDVENG